MLQPLWESRDRYEELKQMDAMKEVSRLPQAWGPRGPATRPGRPSRWELVKKRNLHFSEQERGNEHTNDVRCLPVV